MLISELPATRSIPDAVNIVIEIPAEQGLIKYEVDKRSGLLHVDRFMPTAMHYPCNYGYIPSTLAADGDPVDVLLIAPAPLQPGSIVEGRLLGVLNMEDESGMDYKLLALPTHKICPQYSHIDDIDAVPELQLRAITHFFSHYKDLESGKWVKVTGWSGLEEATKILEESITRYNP